MHVKLELLPVFLLCVSTIPVYADFDIQQTFNDGFDFFGNFTKSTLDATDVDPSVKGAIDDAVDGGVPVAKKGFDLWVSLHHFLVDLIFNNSPIPIDVGIVSIISLVLVGFIAWHFLKKIIKWMIYIALGIIAIFIALIVLGISIPI